MSKNLNDIKDKILWEQIHFCLRGQPDTAVEYCGHQGDEELLEDKLWQYADSALDEEEGNRFWEQIQGCKYCLLKFLAVQKALHTAQQEKGCSLAEIKQLIHQRSKTNVLEITLRFFKDSLELIRNTGLLLTPEPIPVLRTEKKAAPAKTLANLRITKEFDKHKIEVEIQKITSRTCNLEIKVEPAGVGVPLTGLRISLLANKKLLASYIAHEGRAVFNDITSGHYRVSITKDGELMGGVLLNIE